MSGDGPPIVLVHAATADKEAWNLVKALLADVNTVWSYDRRGRGGSGDSAEYGLDREAADVLAVVNAAAQDGPVHLIGHSFGACCALEAAAADDSALASLTLYEPPFQVGRRHEDVEHATALLDSGETERALDLFLRAIAGLSDEELAVLRSAPRVWARALAATPTVPRELRAVMAAGWVPERYRSVAVPTQLLVGELTEADVYLSACDIRNAIAHARVVTLEGQRHVATATGPTVVARSIRAFVQLHQAG